MSSSYAIENIGSAVRSLRNEMNMQNKITLIKELHVMGELSNEEYISELKKAYEKINR